MPFLKKFCFLIFLFGGTISSAQLTKQYNFNFGVTRDSVIDFEGSFWAGHAADSLESVFTVFLDSNGAKVQRSFLGANQSINLDSLVVGALDTLLLKKIGYDEALSTAIASDSLLISVYGLNPRNRFVISAFSHVPEFEQGSLQLVVKYAQEDTLLFDRNGTNSVFFVSDTLSTGDLGKIDLSFLSEDVLPNIQALRISELITPIDSSELSCIEPYDSLIVVFGSSVAKGFRASVLENGVLNGWTERFYGGSLKSNAIFPWTYLNISINGSSTESLINRWGEILNLCPKYLVIAVSLANEGFLDDDSKVEQFKSNLLNLVNRAENEGIIPVLTNVYPNFQYSQSQYEMVKEVNLWIQKLDLPSVNLLGTVDNGRGQWVPGYSADDFHPNDLGYLEMSLSSIPSMYDALGFGKELPFRDSLGSVFLEGESLIFHPEDLVHSFTIAFKFKKDDEDMNYQRLVAFKTLKDFFEVELQGETLVLKMNQQVVDTSVFQGGIDWSEFVLTHNYAKSSTRLYMDQELKIEFEGSYGLKNIVWGSDSINHRISLSELLFYRSGMNEMEVSEMFVDQLLKSSLELYVPFSDTTNLLENIAPTLNELTLFSDSVYFKDFNAFDTLINVPENAVVGDVIGRVRVVDFDDDLHSFTLLGNDEVLTIENDGNVVLKRELDFEIDSIMYFEFFVSDRYNQDTVSVQLNVLDINELPNVGLDSIFIIENSLDTISGYLGFKDPEGDSLHYLLVDSVSEFFLDITTTGEYKLTGSFDFEDRSEFVLELLVADEILLDTFKLIVSVININEPPLFVQESRFIVEENSSGYNLGKLVVSDPEDDPLYFYSIFSDTLVSLSFDEMGVVSLNSQLNYEKSSFWRIPVLAFDGQNYSDTSFVELLVQDKNDSPVIEDRSIFLWENEGLGVFKKIAAMDEDGDELYYFLKSGSSDLFGLSYNGFLALNDNLDYELDSLHSLKVIVSDGVNEDTATFDISIGDINEIATLKSNIFFVKENEEFDLTVEYNDPEGDKLSFVNLQEDSVFTVSENGAISSISPLNFELCSSYKLSLEFSDSHNTDTAEIEISVLDFNDKPIFNVPIQEVEVFENRPMLTKLSANDEDGDLLSYHLKSNSDLFQLSKDGYLSLSSTLDYESSREHSLTIIASDGHYSDTTLVSIIVVNEDESPYLLEDEVVINESHIQGLVCQLEGVDPESELIVFKMVSSDSLFRLSDTGGLYLEGVLDYESVNNYKIDVVLDDGFNLDTVALGVIVSDGNDAPEMIHQNFSITENRSGIIGKIESKDEDGDKLAYHLLENNVSNFTLTTDGFLYCEEGLDFEVSKEYGFSVVVSDGFLYDTAQVYIHVLDENDPPVVKFEQVFSIELMRDTSYVIGRVIASDPDAENLLKFTLTDSPNYLSIDSISGELRYNYTSIVDELQGETQLELLVKVTDGLLQNSGLIYINVYGSLLKLESSNSLNVFPNPSNGYVNIVSPNYLNRFILFDLVGNVLLDESLISGGMNYQLDLSLLPNGVYVLKLQGEGLVETKLIEKR